MHLQPPVGFNNHIDSASNFIARFEELVRHQHIYKSDGQSHLKSCGRIFLVLESSKHSIEFWAHLPEA